MALLGDPNDKFVLDATLGFVDDFSLLDVELSGAQFVFASDLLSAGTCSRTPTTPTQQTMPDWSSHTNPVSPSPTIARPAAPTKRTIKSRKPQNSPNRARRERSYEVRYLREQVVELERRLRLLQQCARLKERQNQLATTTSSSSRRDSPLGETQKLWRDVARHQQRRRELTHRENIRLKSMMEQQRGTLATLTNLLKKQVGEYANAGSPMYPEYVLGGVLDFEGDLHEFQALFHHVDAAYEAVDGHMANALAAAKTLSDTVQVDKDADGKHLEFYSDCVFPYSRQVTAEAAWNYFRGEGKHFGNGGLYKKTAKALAQPYTIVEDFTKELLSNNSRADVRIKQIIRRYKESNRDVVLFIADVTPTEIKHREMPGLAYHFRGYAITQSLSTSPGDELSSLHLRSSIYISNEACEAFDPRHMRSVATFITGNISGNIRSYRERIEDALVDQSLVMKNGPTNEMCGY